MSEDKRTPPPGLSEVGRCLPAPHRLQVPTLPAKPKQNRSKAIRANLQSTATRLLPEVAYPRSFTAPSLAMISYPLGGIGAGSIGLGWKRPTCATGKSSIEPIRAIRYFTPSRASGCRLKEASLWRMFSKPALSHPYEGQDGLGSRNSPGAFPFAGSNFHRRVSVRTDRFPRRAASCKVSLEAWSPFIPLDADESGLPAAILRYRVRNTSKSHRFGFHCVFNRQSCPAV